MLIMDFKKLELNTETIRDLTADEMGRVAGGVENTKLCYLIPTYQCTGMWPTFNGCADTLACKA